MAQVLQSKSASQNSEVELTECYSDDNVRFAGLQALYNSLDFCKNNFANEAERNIIMQTICEATQAPNSKIQVKAFECLVSVMHLYYDSMKYYMEQALFMV